MQIISNAVESLPMMNKNQIAFNRKQAELAAKRGAMFLRLHNKGMTEKDIARKFGISRQRVNQILNKARNVQIEGQAASGLSRSNAGLGSAKGEK